MSHKFFLSNPSGDGFETFATIEERDAAAQKAIDDWLIDGTWHEDVFSITVGEVTGEAVKANIVQRPVELDENGEDEDGNYWDVDMDEKHDVEIRPIATDIIPRSEVAALRAQLYTEAEQRQFVSNLIDNMPHAQIAAELAAFKAEVAAALEKLRAEYEDCPLLGQEFAIEMLDATITALGLTAEAFDALITSQPDVLEKLADEALEEAK